MEPATAYLASKGVEAVGAGLMGNDEQALGNLHLMNPAQRAMWNMMAKQYLSGSGDFGFGSAYKQGKSQLQSLMESRGIAQDSPIAMGAMGDMTASAVNQDAQNRRQSWLELMRTPLQVAQTAGANYVQGSPSTGTTTEAQANNYANKPSAYGQYNWY